MFCPLLTLSCRILTLVQLLQLALGPLWGTSVAFFYFQVRTPERLRRPTQLTSVRADMQPDYRDSAVGHLPRSPAVLLPALSVCCKATESESPVHETPQQPPRQLCLQNCYGAGCSPEDKQRPQEEHFLPRLAHPCELVESVRSVP